MLLSSAIARPGFLPALTVPSLLLKIKYRNAASLYLLAHNSVHRLTTHRQKKPCEKGVRVYEQHPESIRQIQGHRKKLPN